MIASLYADTLLQAGEPKEALRVLTKARNSNEGDNELGFQWAKTQLALGQPEAAYFELQTLRDKMVDDYRVANATGVAFDMLGRHPEAVEAYRDAAALQPNNVAVANNLGLSLALAGRYDDSVAILRGLAEGPDTSPKIRQNLALAYGLDGNYTAAKRVSMRDLTPSEIKDNLGFYTDLRATGKAYQFTAELQPQPDAPQTSEEAEYDADIIKATALTVEEIGEPGKAPGGVWYLDLGEYPNGTRSQAVWNVLRKSKPDETEGLGRLAGAGNGPEPLIVGPVDNEADGMAVCEKLGKAVKTCTPMKL